MPSTQEMLQAITNMQQDAQANLPVTPNNGNPHGANNMPAAMPAQAKGAGHFYPWMQPSSHMTMIKEMLAKPLLSGATTPPPTAGFKSEVAAPIASPTIPVLPTHGAYRPNENRGNWKNGPQATDIPEGLPTMPQVRQNY